ncbi:MAG: hypothetical protein V1821_02315, partial [bacterium]
MSQNQGSSPQNFFQDHFEEFWKRFGISNSHWDAALALLQKYERDETYLGRRTPKPERLEELGLLFDLRIPDCELVSKHQGRTKDVLVTVERVRLSETPRSLVRLAPSDVPWELMDHSEIWQAKYRKIQMLQETPEYLLTPLPENSLKGLHAYRLV